MAGFFDDPMMSMYGTTAQPGFMSNAGLGPFATNLGLALIAGGSGGGAPRSRFNDMAPYLSQAVQAPMQQRQQEMMQKLYGAQIGKLESDAARQRAQDEGRLNLRNSLSAPSMLPMSDMEAAPAQTGFMSSVPQPNRQVAVSLLDAGVEPEKLASVLMPKQGEGFALSPGQTRFDASGRAIASLPATPEKPSDIVQRAVEAGFKPGTPEYQKFISDATLKPNATVNMPPLESAYDKSMGDFYATEYQNLVKGERDAVRSNAQFDLLGGALEKAFSGTGAEAKLALGRAAKTLGMNVDGVAESEVASALSNELALQARNPAGGAGMPGSMSEGDRVFLQNMTPNLAQSKEGRELLLEVRKRQNQRSIEVGKMARDYAGKNNGRLDSGFYDKLSEYADKNPLFTGLEKKLPSIGAGSPSSDPLGLR